MAGKFKPRPAGARPIVSTCPSRGATGVAHAEGLGSGPPPLDAVPFRWRRQYCWSKPPGRSTGARCGSCTSSNSTGSPDDGGYSDFAFRDSFPGQRVVELNCSDLPTKALQAAAAISHSGATRTLDTAPDNLGIWKGLQLRQSTDSRSQPFDAPVPDPASGIGTILASPSGADGKWAFATFRQYLPADTRSSPMSCTTGFRKQWSRKSNCRVQGSLFRRRLRRCGDAAIPG